MNLEALRGDARKAAERVLGYLNFSSGTPDPGFLRGLDDLFGAIQAAGGGDGPTWRVLSGLLSEHLGTVRRGGEAFAQADQAEAVLRLVFDEVLPAYREFHRDLLFHLDDEELFRPLLIGRICEAVLRLGGPFSEKDRIIRGTLQTVNDYIGYRPVAVLETERKIQPYEHEWVRPIPLYVRGAGVAVGRYRELVERALAILEETDPAVLFQAWFEPAQLDELALDPRAYDFDHPVNKRPNYLFGQWDMHCLDNSGRCRRFVVQQAALDAMLARIEERAELPYEEVLFEEAAVLAGTMLMGSGISGNRPDAHSGDTTLATLIVPIASYRDQFYEQVLKWMTGAHGDRLRAESLELRQPFGGARQHFNQQLARRRALQLQHVHLAAFYAHMGHAEAAKRQVDVVPVASARVQCEIHCRLTAARLKLDARRLDEAAALLPEIEDLLHRGIECGALVDPWNILGFGAQFSLFPAVENSIHDHRVDELLDLMGAIFDLYSRLLKEAAAGGEDELRSRLSEGLEKLADWWDQFASTEVDSIEGISGHETRESAEHVATVLAARRAAGAAAGDIAFWRDQLAHFHSAKSYALVVEALLEHGDLSAAMGLLVQWISQAPNVPLVEETYSFHELATRWMEQLWQKGLTPAKAEEEAPDEGRCWKLAKKFLDYLEANAEEYWEVPEFELSSESVAAEDEDENEMEEDDEDDLFRAAYEDVTYRDSTDDGLESEIVEGFYDAGDFELLAEADRISRRLALLTTLAGLWKQAVTSQLAARDSSGSRDTVLAGWLDRAAANRKNLLGLLDDVSGFPLADPRSTVESLLEYDRQRSVKEMLLEQTITTCVETADAALLIRCAMKRSRRAATMYDWEEPGVKVLRAVLRGDTASVQRQWGAITQALLGQPLLYVALARGGPAEKIVASRSVQGVLRRLLVYLPRLGMLRETTSLLETIQDMEVDHPVGPGGITDFHDMFRIGCKGIVRGLVVSADDWEPAGDDLDDLLIGCLEQISEVLLKIWLVHSRGVRLSVLESVSDEKRWQRLREFIEQYGADLFTQHFMSLGNLNGILHQGVDEYLRALEEEADDEEQPRLVHDLDRRLPRAEGVRRLTQILEAVVENYPEYIDYNTITTQSDRGEMLYSLLDFLRLRVSYDRIAWNLQPVVLAHDVLVRQGRESAAEIWRNAVAERTADVADEHRQRYDALAREYGMHLPTIADRLAERFVHPLAVDQLRALIRPAWEPLKRGEVTDAVTRLEHAIETFATEVSGAGIDLPGWLEAIEEELGAVAAPGIADELSPDPGIEIPEVRLNWEQAQAEVEALAEER